MIIPPAVTALFTISRLFIHAPYHDDNVYSAVILMFLLTIGLLLIYLPLPGITYMLKKYQKSIHIISWAKKIIAILLSFLFGLQILLLFTMTSFGKWYIGGPLLFLFWVTCFLLLNRKKRKYMEYNIQEDDENINMCRNNFLKEVVMGVRERLLFSLAMIIMIFIITLSLSLTTCNVCILYSPLGFSTSFSRRIFSQEKICDYNKICFTYLTVPQDISTSIIANYQFYGPPPTRSFVKVSTLNFSSKEPLTSTHYTYESNCFRMDNIVDEERYQCWSDLTNLHPGTTYYYAPVIVFDKVENITIQQSIKFRTGPSMNSTENFVFITGGDMEWSEAGKLLAKKSASKEPLFAIIGGDIAYANGNPYCYRRWDRWFVNWNNFMITSDNYSIPILTCIGNHESGNFMMPKRYDGFYIRYFPHQIGLQSIDPQERPLTHYHLFSSHSIMLALDSWVHMAPIEQKDWLNSTLSKYSTLHNKFALYHISIYPSKPKVDGLEAEIIKEINKHWIPFFDQYALSIAFENHFHCYKSTHPIRNDMMVRTFEGTLYLGDGAWGQKSDDDAVLSSSPIMKEVKNVAHIYSVLVKHNMTKATSYYYDAKVNDVLVLDDNLLA